MNWKKTAILVLGIVLLAGLLTRWYIEVKTGRRTSLRRDAMAAYEQKQYDLAERLLLQYVQMDPNAEKEYAALADIYHSLGDLKLEMQMWQSASSLNPQNPEYYERMLDAAEKSGDYNYLHGILGRKAWANELFSDRELYLYVISSCRSSYRKDGEDTYKKYIEIEPDVFRKNEMGRLAEFMVKEPNLSEEERVTFLGQASLSDNPVIRFEAFLYSVRLIRKLGYGGQEELDQIERLLKQAAEANFFIGTPVLADFYFSRFRFADVIDVLTPYLETINDANMYLLYSESCAFENKKDELKAVEKKLSGKTGTLALVAEYCRILTAYLNNDEETLSALMQKSGNIVISPLLRFIRLRVAVGNGAVDVVRNMAYEIFTNPPFHDLQNRALIICLDFIAGEMKKKEVQKAPSQIAGLARILSDYLQKNRILTEIILFDRHKKDLDREADLLAALEVFPNNALMQRITAEYMLFNEKTEQALSIIKQVMNSAKAKGQEPDREFLFLYMLTLDQLGQRDEAAVVFQKLVEESDFNLELLNQYFQFCVENERKEDLLSMGGKLGSLKDGNLEHFSKFFRAAALLLTEDKSLENEALDLLASVPTEAPEFTFYAANRLCEFGRLDDAEDKYKAILETYRIPPLIYVNLSELYHAKGDEANALEAAREAYDMEKQSMLPAFTYAKRLSEAERYEEAVEILHFPRHAVNYREDVIALWRNCMHHVIEKSIAELKYFQAEEQCWHLLLVAPDDETGKENMEKVRTFLKAREEEILL